METRFDPPPTNVNSTIHVHVYIIDMEIQYE